MTGGISREDAVAFLEEAARYFESRPTKGEDKAHWSNVYNAENCRNIAALLASPVDEDVVEQVEHHLMLLRNSLENERAIPNARDLLAGSIDIFATVQRLREALQTAVNAAEVFLDGGNIHALQAFEDWLPTARAALAALPKDRKDTGQ